MVWLSKGRVNGLSSSGYPAGMRDGRCALAIFVLFLGFYLLTASGHFYAVDEETLYGMTESIVERRSLALPPGLWFIPANQAARGPVESAYMPGQPLLAAPLYLLGRAVVPLFPPDAAGYVTRFFVSLFGSFVTAGTVALLFLLARTLGYRRAAAFGLAAIFGLATMAWPHGRTFFAEPLTAFCALGAFYSLCRGLREGGGRRFWWCALAAVAALAALGVKPHAAVALPFLGLYLLGQGLRARPDRAGKWFDLRGAALAVGGWLAGAALMALPLALYNTARYGGPLRTGYGARPLAVLDPSSYPLVVPEGLYGLTLSSGKGLLWYAPPLLLAVGAFWPFFRRCRAEALTCLGMVIGNIWFYSRIPTWHGDGSWGPRFLAIALPFAILPVAELLERLPGRRVLSALVAVVVGGGVVVQLLGTAVNFDWYIVRSDEATRHFSPAASPILGHARIAAARLDEWYRRATPPPDTAVLTDGFSGREGGVGEPILPRWTTGAGVITLHPGGPGVVVMKLTFFDHRPVALRGGPPTILLNGVSLGAQGIERRDITGTGEGWVYQFAVPPQILADGSATVTLASTPWNPRVATGGARDEDLGVFLNSVEVWRDGQAWSVREGLLPPPMPRTPRGRFWWFNDDRPPDETRHHLIDHWAWYAAVAGFPRALTVAWIGSFAGVGFALLLGGLLLLRPILPRRVRRRPRRRRRGGAGAGRGRVSRVSATP